MLPSLKTSAIAAVTALSVAATTAAPAHAWGDKEQNFVAGLVTAGIIAAIIDDNHRHRTTPAPAPAPRPVYVEPTHASIYSTPTAQAFNSYSRSERKAIQRSLRAYGYYSGGIDGSFGPGTYNAIVAYARASGVAGNLKTAGGTYAVLDGLIY